ncbi:hypothetical protein HRbin15_01629 [bacterium HR15]|nr:hypothetical protein HRbin15_01629 [bacterium HR15]
MNACSSGVRTLWGVLLIVFLSRLPFLTPGFGTDDDGWRVALTAQRLAHTGMYKPSRLPGYPVQEYLSALLIDKGAMAINLLSTGMTLLATACFVLILMRLRCQEPYLPALAFAFTPIIYIASVSAMDYMWAMAFLLLGLWMGIAHRPVLAGLALGLATGCRLTSAVFIIPFLILLYQKENVRGSLIRMLELLTLAGITAALAYSPLYARYGWRFLRHAEAAEPSLIVIGQATIGILGGLGTVAVAALLLWRGISTLRGHALAREQTAFPEPFSRPLSLSFWTASLLTLLLYLRLPHEAAYLIPALPFLLIGLGTLLSRVHFCWLCLSLIASPFVLGIPSPLTTSFVKPSPVAIVLNFDLTRLGGKEVFWIDLLQGPLLLDYQKRLRWDELMRRTVERAGELPPRSLILCDAFRPGVLYYNRGRYPETMFVENFSRQDLRTWLQSGYVVYAMPGVRERVLRGHGFDIYEAGAIPLMGKEANEE